MRLDTSAPDLRITQQPQFIDLMPAESGDAQAVAVADADGPLSYAELREQSAVIASRLRAMGVREGDLVGLCVERSTALVVAALGIFEAGAAYVALDPVHPDERLREMLTDCGAAAVVLGPGLAPRLDVEPDGPPAPGGLGLAPLPAPLVHQQSPGLAYVVYTSGSTGSPKGALVTQAGLSSLVTWHRRAFDLTAADRCSQVAAPGFDAMAWEIWPCLAAGASLHIPPEELKTDPVGLRDWIVAEQITVSFLPTPLAEAMFGLDWPKSTRLRLLLTGGDRLHRAPPPGLPFVVVNNYGVSEATVVSTSGVVAPRTSGEAPSIGRPIDGVQIRIVDGELGPVADGQPGELLLGGVSLARGYLGRPDLTRDRFVSDTDSGNGDNRWYRTGDLVRRTSAGDLEFLGRLDDQVKVRGHRVEPGEVATALSRHPAVAKCVVAPFDDGFGELSLVAYLRPVGVDRPAPDELRAFAARRLPTQMLPAAIVWLDAFPISANGKIDRDALPAPVQSTASDTTTAGATEQVIAAMVADVLGQPTVGPADNFILLGGDSLLAAQLMVRIIDHFDVELPLRTIFERPTVNELAVEVRRLTTAN